MKLLRTYIALAALGVAVAGCNLFSPVDDVHRPDTEAVFSAFLTPGAAVEVTLRSTVPLTEYYPFKPVDDYAIHDAVVIITENGALHTLTEDAQRPGVYVKPGLVADTLVTYSVDVTFPAGQSHPFEDRHLTSSTTVPGQVRLAVELSASQESKGGSLDNLVFPKRLADPERFGITSALTPVRARWTDAAEAAGYLIGTVAHDTAGTSLLRKWDWDEWKDGAFSSPADRQFVQTNGFVALPDSMSAEMVWFLFRYQGRHEIIVYATDSGYHNYFRTTVQGAGQSGADADTGPALNVRGGLGVFGSFTTDTIEVNVAPEDGWLPSQH